MMEQATKLGMPEEWVLLRHAITHGATPGLKVMENAVREAVPWMWGHFWRGLEEEDEVTEDKLREQFVRLLGEYQRQRRAFITSKQEAAVDMSLAAQTSKVIRRMCKKRRDGLDHLVYVLVKENIILPSEKQCVVHVIPHGTTSTDGYTERTSNSELCYSSGTISSSASQHVNPNS